MAGMSLESSKLCNMLIVLLSSCCRRAVRGLCATSRSWLVLKLKSRQVDDVKATVLHVCVCRCAQCDGEAGSVPTDSHSGGVYTCTQPGAAGATHSLSQGVSLAGKVGAR